MKNYIQMKKYIAIILLSISINFLYSQSNINLPTWNVSKLYVNGLTNNDRADYIARALEKVNLVIFAAFSSEEGYGYVMYINSQNIGNVIDYINQALTGYEVTKNDTMQLTKDLYLQIYYMRNNIKSQDIKNQMPQYIQLGPKNELSVQLYELAKQIWIEKYPEVNEQSKKIEGLESLRKKGIENNNFCLTLYDILIF